MPGRRWAAPPSLAGIALIGFAALDLCGPRAPKGPSVSDEDPPESPFLTPYPSYRVLDKWDSPSFNEPTRRVITERLHNVPTRRFFSESDYALLREVIECVLPQPERSEQARIAVEAYIDALLYDGVTSGTRYVDAPAPREAWLRGLRGIDHESRRRHGAAFGALGTAQRHQVLHAIDDGEVDAPAWAGLHPKRFFRSVLLKEAVKIYYVHPSAWNEMGFGGPAAPRGYVRLGADELDPWEATPQRAPQPVRRLA